MKSKPTKRPAPMSASRRAFTARFGASPGFDIAEYAATQRDFWTVWEAARKWQRDNPTVK